MKLLAVIALAGLVAGNAAGGGTGSILPGQILDLFEQRGVAYDSDAVLEAATRAILQAVDSRAKLVEGEGLVVPGSGSAPAMQSVAWSNKVGYIRLACVSSNAAVQAVATVCGWAEDEFLGCVLDVRQAEGCELSGVAQLAGLCASSGVHVLTVRTVEDEDRAVQAAPIDRSGGLPPLMLLIDSGTAGAAEALAAAVKGRAGVLLIGETTAADGRIREWLEIDDAHRVYMATDTAHLPSGAAITDAGVTPDVAVLPDEGLDAASLMAPFEAVRETCQAATNQSAFLAGLATDPALLRAADIIIGLEASVGPGANPEPETEPEDSRPTGLETGEPTL